MSAITSPAAETARAPQPHASALWELPQAPGVRDEHQPPGPLTVAIAGQPYTAGHPWGPWSLRHSQAYDEGWYNTCILVKPLIGFDPGTVPIFIARLGGHDLEFYNLHVGQLSLAVLND